MTNKEGYKDPTAEQAIAYAARKERRHQRMANAIADLMEFYDQAKKSDRIRNPEAWALYQTWKRYNTEATKHD